MPEHKEQGPNRSRPCSWRPRGSNQGYIRSANLAHRPMLEPCTVTTHDYLLFCLCYFYLLIFVSSIAVTPMRNVVYVVLFPYLCIVHTYLYTCKERENYILCTNPGLFKKKKLVKIKKSSLENIL